MLEQKPDWGVSLIASAIKFWYVVGWVRCANNLVGEEVQVGCPENGL